MERDILAPLTPIILEVRDEEGEGRYSMMIFGSDEAEGVMIGAPGSGGSDVKLETGSIVTVQITRPDGLRRFTTEVVGSSAEGGRRIRLAWPRRIEHVQRRQTFRVEVSVDVTVVAAEGAPPVAPLKGFTLDLSEGGTRLSLPAELEPETLLDIRLHLREHGEHECRGQVLRSGRITHPPGERYWSAIRFVELGNVARRGLVRFIFQVQRDMVRRGYR